MKKIVYVKEIIYTTFYISRNSAAGGISFCVSKISLRVSAISLAAGEYHCNLSRPDKLQ